MGHRSTPELLALHGVRVLGSATPGEVAARYRLDAAEVLEPLLDALGARQVATEAHAAFLPLSRRIGTVFTRWQIRPTPSDRMAANDHTDWP